MIETYLNHLIDDEDLYDEANRITLKVEVVFRDVPLVKLLRSGAFDWLVERSVHASIIEDWQFVEILAHGAESVDLLFLITLVEEEEEEEDDAE